MGIPGLAVAEATPRVCPWGPVFGGQGLVGDRGGHIHDPILATNTWLP